MKASATHFPATGAGSLGSRRPGSPRGRAGATGAARVGMVAATLGSLGLLCGVALLAGKAGDTTPSAGSRFLSSRVLVRSSSSPARVLRLPSVSLTASDKASAAVGPKKVLPSLRAQPPVQPRAADSGSVVAYTAEALADEITALPGLKEKLSFRHFSGYLPISLSKNIFYWYVEAAEAPEEKPLVFWTNGGPGCSGLFGFLNENGPFRPTKDGKAIKLNPFSWNAVANMVFVEQPVTVGFSYTTEEKDKHFSDDQAAADNHAVLQAFYARFPHLREKELHLSGESYGGHYLPTLAKYIVEQNELPATDAAQRINLKGFLVGNPLTDPVENMIGAIDSFWGHSLVPHDLYTAWAEDCRQYTGHDDGSGSSTDILYSSRCSNLQNAMWSYVRGLNPYALDYPVCEEPGSQLRKPRESAFPPAPDHIAAAGRGQRYKLLSHTFAPFVGGKEAFDQPTWTRAGEKAGYEPCEDGYAVSYLNRPDVQAAIHAKAPADGSPWADCSDTVFYYFDADSRHTFMQPIYKYLLDERKDLGLRVMVFSGDDDSVCATQGTSLWIDHQGWEIKNGQEWMAWGVGQQVAGYIQGYANNFTFATVHGAGHEVPAYKPEAALALFTAYIQDKVWSQ